MTRFLRRLLIATCCCLPPFALAETFPSKPVRMVVGWPAGGPADAIARMVTQGMSDALGQSVVIDNRAGAGGNIGSEATARAKPDGYTIMLATVASHGINPALYPKLNYDPIGDFAPIGLITTSPSTLVVPANSPFKTVRELIDAARAAPGKLNYGSAGNGSSPHLATSRFNVLAGVDIKGVPYKGTAPALTDLMAGRVDFMITIGSIPYVKSGQLRALAVASRARIPAMPDVPTFDEAGLPNFYTDWWYGLAAPAGTPRPILERLNQALNAALANPQLQRQLVDLGALPVPPMGVDAFWEFVVAGMPRTAEMVRASGAKVE